MQLLQVWMENVDILEAPAMRKIYFSANRTSWGCRRAMYGRVSIEFQGNKELGYQTCMQFTLCICVSLRST